MKKTTKQTINTILFVSILILTTALFSCTKEPPTQTKTTKPVTVQIFAKSKDNVTIDASPVYYFKK